ncbi:MAG: nucleotidyl transferase AbiEii/AbiGii toxin family protein, partial [Bacteroidota bacterium]
MLHTETVEPGTLSILKELLRIDELRDFSLVGGTALSLLYGHRESVDLDLFCSKAFENNVMIDCLKKSFGDKFVMEQKPP